MIQYVKFMEMSMSLSLNILMLFLIRQKIAFHFPPRGKSLLNFLRDQISNFTVHTLPLFRGSKLSLHAVPISAILSETFIFLQRLFLMNRPVF